MNCSYCNALLPQDAKFCSSCGERVEQLQNKGLETHTKQNSDDAQEQEAKTVRLVSPPQLYLKRWLSYQSQNNNNHAGRSPESSPSLQDSGETPQQPISSSQVMASADEIVLLVAPIQNERAKVSPTMPDPSIPETEEQTSIRANWLWPTIIIFSALAASLVNFVFTGIAIRPIIVFWFLFICPGMTVIRFLRLKEPAVEWTLAIALSFAIDAIVAGIQLYAGKWSPTATLGILIGFCFIGSAIQLAKMVPIPIIKMYPVIKAMKRRTEKSVPPPEDNSPIEPPVLKVTDVSTAAQFSQPTHTDQNG